MPKSAVSLQPASSLSPLPQYLVGLQPAIIFALIVRLQNGGCAAECCLTNAVGYLCRDRGDNQRFLFWAGRGTVNNK